MVASGVALAGKAAAKKAANSKVGKAAIGLLLAILIGVPVGGIGVVLLGLQVLAGSAGKACLSVPVAIDLSTIPEGPIAGSDHEKLVAAGNIMNAATKLGLDGRAQQIGLMTAIGESGIRPFTYGDGAINPDGSIATSIRYFQSAALFFQRYPGVKGSETMEPTLVANAIQGNLDPNYYVPFWEQAGRRDRRRTQQGRRGWQRNVQRAVRRQGPGARAGGRARLAQARRIDARSGTVNYLV